EGSAQTLRSSVSVSVQLCEINGQYFLGQWDSGMHFNDEPKPYFRSANLLNEGDAEPLFRGRYEDNRTSGMLRVNPKTLNGIYSDFSPSDLVVNVKCKK